MRPEAALSQMEREITLAKGQVEQDNLDKQPPLRMRQVHRSRYGFERRNSLPQGLGEPMPPTVNPAAANAVFAATGKRVRALPLKRSGFAFVLDTTKDR